MRRGAIERVGGLRDPRASFLALAAAAGLAAWALSAGSDVPAPAAADANGGALRVYAVESQLFEYLFTAAGTGADGKALLFFRSLAGNVWSVHVGDRVGAWTVAAYAPRKVRVFKPSVNAWIEEDASSATLRGSDGAERVLTQGTPVEEPGLMACLVSLDSGRWVHARAGDCVALDGLSIQVLSVTNRAARAQVNGRECALPLASDDERQAMLDLWQTRRQQAEEAQAARVAEQAAEQQRQRDAAAASQAAAVASLTRRDDIQPSPVQYSFGSEYRYPVEYEVLPYSVLLPNGRMGTRAIVIPRRFDTRQMGMSFGVR